jgi:uncharacterized lipoprotein YmbA
VKFYLGEEPILKNVPTWLCRDAEHLSYVLDHLEEIVVKEVHLAMSRSDLGALLLAGTLAACSSSSPSHYYVLSAQSDPAAVRRMGHPGQTVAVGAVKLPGALDRPQIARRLGPNQLDYSESERWAGPLDDMTRRVLSADLLPLLPAGTTMIADDSSTPADRTIAIEMSRFDADKEGRVALDASWNRF